MLSLNIFIYVGVIFIGQHLRTKERADAIYKLPEIY